MCLERLQFNSVVVTFFGPIDLFRMTPVVVTFFGPIDLFRMTPVVVAFFGPIDLLRKSIGIACVYKLRFCGLSTACGVCPPFTIWIRFWAAVNIFVIIFGQRSTLLS